MLNQSFKFKSYTFFVFINISREQARAVFFKARLNKLIFERDFFYYNKIFNRIARQFKKYFKNLNRDYVSIYLFDNSIISNIFTRESLFKLIDDEKLFDIIIQFVEFNFFISFQFFRVFYNIFELLSSQ